MGGKAPLPEDFILPAEMFQPVEGTIRFIKCAGDGTCNFICEEQNFKSSTCRA